MQESRLVAPNTPHAWLCEGRLLQLQDAIDPGNLTLFQQQWDRGQPVLISNSNERMNHRLWHPRAFAKDFGHIRSDLVNTLTGKRCHDNLSSGFGKASRMSRIGC